MKKYRKKCEERRKEVNYAGGGEGGEQPCILFRKRKTLARGKAVQLSFFLSPSPPPSPPLKTLPSSRQRLLLLFFTHNTT
uniref:Uncharacterized protein n=1 Tax=Caenorhabditis japonica TaxID=281687 RepID=A0A8R1EW03_CAEJA